MLNNNTVKQRFEYILGKKSAGFISSLLSLTNANPKLQECNPQTVLSAAMTAATLDLPINPNLGFAYIVPYRNKGVMQAQYQMGYKGYIQLAMRTGQYKTVNVCPVYEGQIQEIDCFTGEISRGEKASDTIVGYMAYFKLINGFEKYLYMTVAELEAHGRKYSKAYGNLWASNFSAMASKTVLKLLISKYGIMSIEMMGMEKALAADQAVINYCSRIISQGNPQLIRAFVTGPMIRWRMCLSACTVMLPIKWRKGLRLKYIGMVMHLRF